MQAGTANLSRPEPSVLDTINQLHVPDFFHFIFVHVHLFSQGFAYAANHQLAAPCTQLLAL
jgi:hypothetical protein